MKNNRRLLWIILLLASPVILVFAQKEKIDADQFVTYIADPKKQDIKLYWKDDKQVNFRSIQNLKSWLDKKHKTLVFAMNAGMYKPDNSPQGLYVDEKKLLSPLDTATGIGNFYLKPNGIFYITTENVPMVCNTATFVDNGKIKYATQSGPMLVVDGEIHPAFKKAL